MRDLRGEKVRELRFGHQDSLESPELWKYGHSGGAGSARVQIVREKHRVALRAPGAIVCGTANL